MKYFAEYLIEMGVLTEDKLVELMIDQIENSPSIINLVNKSKLLSSQQILSALKHQSEKNVEFKKACEELGFWNSEMEIFIRAEYNKTRQPLGVSIISHNILTLEQLTKHFDEYFSSQAKEVNSLTGKAA